MLKVVYATEKIGLVSKRHAKRSDRPKDAVKPLFEGISKGFRVFQNGAGEGNRTPDVQLGKLTFCL